MLLTCQAIYGVERGAELSVFIEGATGSPCPCKQNKPCALMPRQGQTSLQVVTNPSPPAA